MTPARVLAAAVLALVLLASASVALAAGGVGQFRARLAGRSGGVGAARAGGDTGSGAAVRRRRPARPRAARQGVATMTADSRTFGSRWSWGFTGGRTVSLPPTRLARPTAAAGRGLVDEQQLRTDSRPRPAAIGDLSRLRVLNLYDNFDLTAPLPPEVGNLHRLGVLGVTSTASYGLLPASVCNLSNLRQAGSRGSQSRSGPANSVRTSASHKPWPHRSP